MYIEKKFTKCTKNPSDSWYISHSKLFTKNNRILNTLLYNCHLNCTKSCLHRPPFCIPQLITRHMWCMPKRSSTRKDMLVLPFCLFIAIVRSGELFCSQLLFCKSRSIFDSIFLKSTSSDVLQLYSSLIYRLYTDFELKGRKRKAKQVLNMASVHVCSTRVTYLKTLIS